MFRTSSRVVSTTGLYLTLSVVAALPVFAEPANVTTWRNDNARSGINSKETVLTPSNVNSTDFGKLFEIAVDGIVIAQPLYLSGVNIPGKGSHNVVYIATEHDSVYACDADDGTILWHAVLLKAGETPSDNHGCTGIALPEVGITATPVISGNAIYVQTMTKNTGGTYAQRLHALNLTTGAELFGGPVDIVATYPGTGAEGSNGTLTFDPSIHFDRASLVLGNGVIYTTWTSFCDAGPYTSWVIGYNTSLQQVSILNLTPNGGAGSIWGSGAAPAMDAEGNLFTITGNGTLDSVQDPQGFPLLKDFGNSFVKISTANNTPQVIDYWSPFDTPDENSADLDLGSGGLLLLPDMTDATNQVRHLVVGAGKDHHIYIADRDNMGKFRPNSSDNSNLYQDVPPEALAQGVFSTPLFFDGRLYISAVGDKFKAFQFTNARLDTMPFSESTNVFGFPSTIPSLSANGTSAAIIWAAQRVPDGQFEGKLYAYDPNDLSHQFYNSTTAANGRDGFGVGAKFAVPTIANGKVYVGATGNLAVFGLFNPPRFGNISTRADIGTGENVLIGGFIIQGSAPRKLVIRGIGPSIKVNGSPLAGTLQDPVLELRDNAGAAISTNDNWGDSPQASEISAAGLAPKDSRESAILMTLNPGTYTAIVRGVNNSTGLGLVEIYDLSAPNSTLANLSSRGFVGTGDDVLIGGLIIVGVAPQSVILRAIGPDLASKGIGGSLSDPTLELHDANGAVLAFNDNWRSNQEAEISASGLAPGNDKDAAILRTLPAANYTAIVRGAAGSTGIALVEAYALR